jgi:tol-pal system protein YbgF
MGVSSGSAKDGARLNHPVRAVRPFFALNEDSTTMICSIRSANAVGRCGNGVRVNLRPGSRDHERLSMTRRPTFRRARPILVLLATALTLLAPEARSQDRAVQDRLDRLERDLSMLQRQVYRGGSPQVITAGSTSAVDVELRMDRLETQMRELTGRVEAEVNAVEQLQHRLEQINSDLDVRFSQVQGQPRSAPSNSHAAAGLSDASPAGVVAMRGVPPAAAPRFDPPGDLPPGTVVPPPPGPVSGGGTLTPPGLTPSRTELADVAGAGSLRPPPTNPLPTGSALGQYNAALGLLKQADYSAAEEALRSFIVQHPNDPLAGSAQYLLGDTYYQRGRYTEAASAFAEGYKNYPKGPKAPDDLLKLGMALARTNQKQNACIAFAQLDRDFPHLQGAIRERATEEKRRLGC